MKNSASTRAPIGKREWEKFIVAKSATLFVRLKPALVRGHVEYELQLCRTANGKSVTRICGVSIPYTALSRLASALEELIDENDGLRPDLFDKSEQ